MSYRPYTKTDNGIQDWAIDAETVKGHAVETTGISSNTDTLATTAQVKAYVDANAGSGGSEPTYIDEEITLTQFETMLDETSVSQFSQSFQDLLKDYDSNTDNYRIVVKQNDVVRYYLVFDYVTRNEYEDDHYEKYYHFKCSYDSTMPSGITANYNNGKLQINEFRWLDIGIYYSWDSSKSYDYTDSFSFGYNYSPIYNIKTVNGTSLLGSGNISISGELPSISTQYIRVSDLETGVYKLTYAGEKYLYYKGLTSTSTISISAHSGAMLFYVEKYNVGGTYYWKWWYTARGASSSNIMTITYGSTRSNAGLYESQDLTTIAHTNFLKTINGNNIIGTGSINTLYKHKISIEDTDHSEYMHFVVYKTNSTYLSANDILNLIANWNMPLTSPVFDSNSNSFIANDGYVIPEDDAQFFKFKFHTTQIIWYVEDGDPQPSNLEFSDSVSAV